MYKVLVEFDGSPRGFVNQRIAQGDFGTCVKFVSSYLAPKGYELSIIDAQTGRCVSFMMLDIPHPKRLTWAQIFNGEPFPI